MIVERDLKLQKAARSIFQCLDACSLIPENHRIVVHDIAF